MSEWIIAVAGLAGMCAAVWALRDVAHHATQRAQDAEARERRTMERLLSLQAASGAPVMTDAEASFTRAESLEEDDPAHDLSSRPLSQAEQEFLVQWEDPRVRQRWQAYLDGRVQDGRTPNQALADAELQLVAGRPELDETTAGRSARTFGEPRED